MSKQSQQFIRRRKGNLRPPGGRTGCGTGAENEEKQQHPRSVKTEGRSRRTPEECKALSKWCETADTSEGAASRWGIPGDEGAAASSDLKVVIGSSHARPRRAVQNQCRPPPANAERKSWRDRTPSGGVSRQPQQLASLSKAGGSKRWIPPNRRRKNGEMLPSYQFMSQADAALEKAARIMIAKVQASPAAALGRGRTPQDPLSGNASVRSNDSESSRKNEALATRTNTHAIEAETEHAPLHYVPESTFDAWKYVEWKGEKETDDIKFDPEAAPQKYVNRRATA